MGKTGRPYTATVNSACKIFVSQFTSTPEYKEHGKHSQRIAWDRGGEIVATIEGETITITDPSDQQPPYIIRIQGKRSNLGKGLVYCFICPITGKRSKILYRTHNKQKFASREAYGGTLLYPTQTESKRWVDNSRYFEIKRRLEQLEAQPLRTVYNGKVTKRALLLIRLRADLIKAGEARNAQFVGLFKAKFPSVLN